MDTPFPADVSLRVTGELADAQPLFSVARTVLNRALSMQANGVPVVRLFVPLPGGGLVSAFLIGDQKHLYVTPAQSEAPPTKQPSDDVSPVEPQITYVPSMLSGVVRKAGVSFNGPDVIEVINTPDPATFELRTFHPSSTTSTVYFLDFAWQNSEKLAVTNAGTTDETGPAISAYPKPSMFSGAMKRFYQALLGLGTVLDAAQEGYISGTLPPTDPDTIVFPQFSWQWNRTHGICFQGGAVWLVEINKDEGVLAMPVPVFNETASPSFAAWLDSIGDFETGDVVVEFGGVPTGEPFPTGAGLTAAIAAGLVVRIMDAATLEPAYHDAALTLDKWTLAHDIGWAFSESGVVAALTTFYYKDEAKAKTELPEPPGVRNYTADERFMLSEHWHINISGLAIDEETALPITTATATLELFESLHVWGHFNRFLDETLPILAWHVKLWVPVSPHTNSDALVHFPHNGWHTGVLPVPNPGESPPYYDVWPEHGPIMFSFFDGEREELVRQNRVFWSGYPVEPPMILDDVGFCGDSAAIVTSYFYGAPHLIIPKYCREGYIILTMVSLDVIGAVGYFDDAGLIEFDYETGIDLSSYIYRLCTYGSPAVGSAVEPFCGATMNAAIGGGFLMTNRCHFDDWPNFYYPDVDRSFLQSDNIVSYEIPGTVTPAQLTFVGAP